MKTLILFILCFWLLPALPAWGQVDGLIDRKPVREVIDNFRQKVLDNIGSEYLIEDGDRDARVKWEKELDEWLNEQEDEINEWLNDYEDDEDGNTQ